MKIHPVGAELFHEDKRADRRIVILFCATSLLKCYM